MKYKNILLNVFCLVRAVQTFHCFSTGLCGNFNDIQTDDFKAISGVIEGTATAFANTWRTQASCPNIQRSFENPCALSIDNGACLLECFLGIFSSSLRKTHSLESKHKRIKTYTLGKNIYLKSETNIQNESTRDK